MTSDAASRQTRLGANNRWTDPGLRERLRGNNASFNRSDLRNAVTRAPALQPFNRNSVDSNFKERSSSRLNTSRSASFWSERRAAVTNNWRSGAFTGRQYWAFHNYHRQWHDRGWWHNHCGDRIVFVTVYAQPFPFYFDAGYWYPAWGYYPDSYYPYDGPIYGYDDLPPDEIIANVQTQLYNEGYYEGPIDGILGPDTRAAIADYQADHGLAVTAAIDQPTVEVLGLT
jgi:Putative peptidoglycan binding domain